MMSLQAALILKNDTGNRKVLVLHKEYGKIICHYSDKHNGLNLCTGSLVYCSVIVRQRSYTLDIFEVCTIPQSCTIEDITFFHNIVALCMKHIPYAVKITDIFEYLWHVFLNVSNLSDQGKKIVILKLFYVLDVIALDIKSYMYIAQDPYHIDNFSEHHIDVLLAKGWDVFNTEYCR